MSIKSAEIKAVTRIFYINQAVPYISRVGRRMKKCIVLESGREIYYSYSVERFSDSLVVNKCIDRFTNFLLEQNYQGEVVIYLNSQFVGFDTREDNGWFLGSSPDKPPQILLRLRYLEKKQISFANEIIKSLTKSK